MQLLLLFFCISVVVSEQDSAAAQQYSRQGCPTGLRAQLWTLILNTTDDPEVLTEFQNAFFVPIKVILENGEGFQLNNNKTCFLSSKLE